MPRPIANAPLIPTTTSAQHELPISTMTGPVETAQGYSAAWPPLRTQAAAQGNLAHLAGTATRQAQGRRPGGAVAGARVAPTVLQSVAESVGAWIAAAPANEVGQRKTIARIIERAAAERSPDLRISGLQVTSLPDCISRLPLRNLAIVDCGLLELPTLPPRLDSLFTSCNRLQQLPRLPATLRHLDASANLLTSVPQMPGNIVNLNLRSNRLTAVDALPLRVRQVDLSGNRLTSLPAIPTATTHLNVSMNPLQRLGALPPALEDLQASHAALTQLPPLPKGLQRLRVRSNRLTMLPALPAALTHLEASENFLAAMPTVPDKMLHLALADNCLAQLPDLPRTLITLDVSNNHLLAMSEQIARLPELVHLDFSANRLSTEALETALAALHERGKNMTHVRFRQTPRDTTVTHAARQSDAVPTPIRRENETEEWDLLDDPVTATALAPAAQVEHWEVVPAARHHDL